MIRRPLLAAKTTDADLQNWKRWPMLLSPKIDGVRALVVKGELRSRSMKLIPNKHTQALFGKSELEGLDGELVVGNPFDKNLMQQTASGIMSHNGKPDVTYWIFDSWIYPADFHERNKFACKMIGGAVQGVPHIWITSYEELMFYEEQYLTMGYEGVMLRDPHGRYKQNRSTLREGILLKVKRFVDGEAQIIDFEPLRRNLNAQVKDERGYAKRSTHQENKVPDELLGAFLVKDLVSGITFSIGSGFTEAQRQDFWDKRFTLTGKIIKYKSQHCGVKDKPRIPIFLGFRSPIDM